MLKKLRARFESVRAMRSPLHIPLVRYSCRGRVHELYCNFASVHTGLIPSSYQRRLNSSGLMRRNQQFQKLAAISLEVIKRRWYHTFIESILAAKRGVRAQSRPFKTGSESALDENTIM